MKYVKSKFKTKKGIVVEGLLVDCKKAWNVVGALFAKSGLITLFCDGYNLTISKRQKTINDRALYVVVDGGMKEEWITKPTPISIKFLQKRKLHSFHNNIAGLKEEVLKSELSQKEKDEMIQTLDVPADVYDPKWSGWGPLMEQLKKCNEIIFPTSSKWVHLLSEGKK